MGEQIDDRIDEQEVIHRPCCRTLSNRMVGATNLESGFDGGGDKYEYQRTWFGMNVMGGEDCANILIWVYRYLQ